MSDTGKQSPLGINVLGSILQNIGLNINPVTSSYVGESKEYPSYTFGTLCQDTVLQKLTQAIDAAYTNSLHISDPTTYNNLISIGANTIPALGNTPPDSYSSPSNTNPGNIDGLTSPWTPWNTTNSNVEITRHGYIRLFALQAWNEFNYNNEQANVNPFYNDFLGSFVEAYSFINSTNATINSMNNALSFLDGTFSNMDDLITSDVTGVNLATQAFGQDLVALGKAIDLSKIQYFGLPSNLLQTLKKYNCLTQSLSLALLSSGIEVSTINQIASGEIAATTEQEQKIYGALLLIQKEDLQDILIPLNCKTKNLNSAADLVDVQKLFPLSYPSMTVPVYNTDVNQPTNSKTYYRIYENGGINPILNSPNIVEQVGSIIAPTLPESVTTIDTLIDNFDVFNTNDLVKLVTDLCDDNVATLAQNLNSGYFDNFGNPIQNNTDPASFILNRPSLLSDNTNLANPFETSTNFQELPKGFGSYLNNILPDDVATAAGAFAASMQQVKNITQVDIEKFAQVVGSLETTKGLTLLGNTTNPANVSLVQSAINSTSLGSGPNGTYTMSDFFGCMSGLPYAWQDIQRLITELQTSNLATIYDNLYNLCNVVSPDPLLIQPEIDNANNEIQAILTNNSTNARLLNTLWQITGTQLSLEQGARLLGLTTVPTPKENLFPSPTSQFTFIDTVPLMATNTEPHMAAQTLEAISDWSTSGGQNLVAMTRQQRNKERLNSAGIPLDDTIPDTINPKLNAVLLSNGTVPIAKQGVEIAGIGCNPNDTTIFTIPSVLSVQTDTGEILSPTPAGYYNPNDEKYYLTNPNYNGQGGVTDSNNNTVLGDLAFIEQNNQGKNLLGPNCNGTGPDIYNNIETIQVGNKVATGIGIPIDTGSPEVNGSLAGSPYKQLLPNNLNSAYISKVTSDSTYSVNEAIDEVDKCNCDC